jgi:hypothetical protein
VCLPQRGGHEVTPVAAMAEAVNSPCRPPGSGSSAGGALSSFPRRVARCRPSPWLTPFSNPDAGPATCARCRPVLSPTGATRHVLARMICARVLARSAHSRVREVGRYALVVIGARVGDECASDPIAEFIERACEAAIVRQAGWSPGFGAQFVLPVDRRPVALEVGPHRRVVRVCFHEQTAKVVNEHTGVLRGSLHSRGSCRPFASTSRADGRPPRGECPIAILKATTPSGRSGAVASLRLGGGGLSALSTRRGPLR